MTELFKNFGIFGLKFSFLVVLILVLIEFHSKLNRDRTSDEQPVLTMYELVNMPLDFFKSERNLTLTGYFGADQRIYVGRDDAKYGNLKASFPVRYEEFMRGCLDSYVNIIAKVKYYPNKEEVMIFEFNMFSHASRGEIDDKLSEENFVRNFEYQTHLFNCNIEPPLENM